MCFLMSCNNNEKILDGKKENSNKTIQPNKEINADSIFQKKLEAEPKLFLEFWPGMSHDEYDKVKSLLIEQKKLGIGLDPNFGSERLRLIASDNCYADVFGEFANNKLKSIKLNNINCLYAIYKEKYNLPPLLEKSSIEQTYIENNPNYKPQFFYEDFNNKQVTLPDAFYDKKRSLDKGRIYLKNSNNSNALTILPKTVYVLSENPIIVENQNIVLKIEQTKKKYENTEYSLWKSERIKNYFKTKEGKEKYWEQVRFITTNSVLRTVTIQSTYDITATYMSLSEYKRELNLNSMREKDSLERLKLKKEKLETVFDKI